MRPAMTIQSPSKANANNKDAECHLYQRSLISATVVRYLDRILCIFLHSKHRLVYAARKPALGLTYETTEGRFLAKMLKYDKGKKVFSIQFQPRHEKTCHRDIGPVPTQIGPYSRR